MKKALIFIGKTLLVLVIAVILFYLANLMFLFSWMAQHEIGQYLSRKPFNSELWKNDVLVKDGKWDRINMIDDLFAHHNLMGKSEEEIKALLGEPEPKSFSSGCDYEYELGPERSLISIDNEFLCLKFKDGRVVEATTQQG